MRAEPLRSPADLVELRERAAGGGPELLTDAECLALLLRRAAGRAAPVWAGWLLARFGSLPELLGAPEPALAAVAPAAVRLDLALLHDLQRRSLAARLRTRPALGAFSLVRDYLRVMLAAERREQFRVLFLDKGHRLITDEVMGRGTFDHAPVYPREVLRRALELDACGLVLAHNHPGGDPHPSAADLEVTRQLIEAGRALRVTVHDHLIVAGEVVRSLRGSGDLP